MTVEQYEKAKKVISFMERYSNEIDKLKIADGKYNPHGYLKVETDVGLAPISITVNVDMMKRCILLLHDMYQELYHAKQKELEAL